jgi:hypothetical protein
LPLEKNRKNFDTFHNSSAHYRLKAKLIAANKILIKEEKMKIYQIKNTFKRGRCVVALAIVINCFQQPLH